MPNLWFEYGRGKRRPEHQAQSLAGVLIGRNVDVGNAIDIETVTLDVLDNTHDGRPWLRTVFADSHSAAQRIAIRPILTSGGFIDEGRQRFAVFIALGK